MKRYSKAIAAAVGGALTASFGIVPPHTVIWNVLTIISAAGTAASVWAIPNVPAGTRVG